VEHAAEVRFDRPDAQAELDRDLLVRQASSCQLEQAVFTLGQGVVGL
jgi:hypothetical protein